MTFTIYLTTECNFKCKYCYEQFSDHLNLSEKNAFKIVDYIMGVTNEDITIVFMGGEPLLFKKTHYKDYTLHRYEIQIQKCKI